jgi:hypothetical protein
MVEQILVQKIEPARLRIGDKMNFVPMLGKRFPKLCGYHPTTPEGRIANNSNLDFIH